MADGVFFCESRKVIGEKTRSDFAKWFPVPQLLMPQTCGVDISDSSVKCLSLKEADYGYEVDRFGTGKLDVGIVSDGVVQNPAALGDEIKTLVRETKAPPYVHVALPEEAAYVFVMHVQEIKDRIQVRTLIEFELEGRVPLKLAQAVYDYDVTTVHDDGSAEIAVSVFPKMVVEGYVAACEAAGVVLMSLELEARSIARAIVPHGSTDVSLMVDFGRARTGIAILKGAQPIFTSTVLVGGDSITRIVKETLNIEDAAAEAYKNEEGMASQKNPKVSENILGTASALADEILRHYQYWDTRRNEHGERVTPVRQILLTGGSSNLKGLPEYLSGRVHARAVRADVWQNVCSFEHYIPSIDEHHGLGLSSVIGLALRNF